jgi:hypothetical protein
MDIDLLMRRFTIRMRMLGAIAVVLVLLALLGGAGLFGMFRIQGLSENFLKGSYAESGHFSNLRVQMGLVRRHEKDMIIQYEKPEGVKAAHTKWLASLGEADKQAKAFLEGEEDADNEIVRKIIPKPPCARKPRPPWRASARLPSRRCCCSASPWRWPCSWWRRPPG